MLSLAAVVFKQYTVDLECIHKMRCMLVTLDNVSVYKQTHTLSFFFYLYEELTKTTHEPPPKKQRSWVDIPTREETVIA